MKRSTVLIGTLLWLAAGTAMTQSSSPPPTSEPAVAQIIVLDVGPNPSITVPKIIAIMKKANAVAQKTGGHGKARLWNMSFAGPDSGKFVIVVETPTLALMAADGVKMRADPEWNRIMADVEASGAKLVSESLLTEVPF